MGLTIGTKTTTQTAKIIQKKERTHTTKKKTRKRIEGIDYSYYGHELEQKKGDVTHVEFLSQTNEGVRFSVCGHFAIKYKPDSPEIYLFINPDTFKDKTLDLTSSLVEVYDFIGLEAIKEKVFDFVNKNKDKFIVK